MIIQRWVLIKWNGYSFLNIIMLFKLQVISWRFVYNKSFLISSDVIAFLLIIDMGIVASKPDLHFSLKYKYKTNPTLVPIPLPCLHKMYCNFWGRLNIVNPRTCDCAGQSAPSPRAPIAVYLQLCRRRWFLFYPNWQSYWVMAIWNIVSKLQWYL